MVDQSGKSGVTFNVISAHSNFSEDIQIERMVDGSGKPDERNSSNAQIRTLLEEQRQTIIAEYREKVSHHELSSSTKSYRNGRIMEIPESYFRYYGETKTHRGSEHDFGIIRQSTGTAK